jgi:hypothetical protein
MARQFVSNHNPIEPHGLLIAGSGTALTAPIDTPQTWDIFCRVIDNFGDIGVTWRLARLLTDEHGKAVRLWVDDLSALSRLMPATDVAAEIQKIHDIEVCRWSTGFPDATPATVVIEAFGCALPDRYIAAMPGHCQVWFNFEYFTAEAWAVGCHGLPSPQPNGIAKIFAFPGIQPGTGGLLREAALLTDRQKFLQQPDVRLTWAARWHIPLPSDHSLAILLNRDWNAQIFIPAHWDAVIAALPELRAQAEQQMRHLSDGEELAQWLVKTANQRLQCATI